MKDINKYPIVDAHCHIQFPAYDKDREAVIRRAQEAGVKMIVGGTQAVTSKAGIELAHKYPDDIWATVGFHPSYTAGSGQATSAGSGQEEFDVNKLRELAKDKKVVGIGECGLDYYQPTTNDQSIRQAQNKQLTILKDLQKGVFLKMAELANELNKPLVIHCRPSRGSDDAYEDILNILQKIEFSQNIIIHFYVGSLETTRKFLDAGFYPHTKRVLLLENANGANARCGVGVYFTFGGVITFTRDYDEIIKYIPMDRILLETDAPYVSPEPYRGKRNEPAYVIEVAKKLAEIKNISLDDLIEATYSNTRWIFKI